MTALILVPLLGGVGVSLDYSYSYGVQSKLMTVADAASLGALSKSSPGYAAAMAMQQDGEVSIAEADGKRLFLAQSQVAGIAFPVEASLKVTKKGGNLTAVTTFSATVPTTFMQIFGKRSMAISGQSTAVYEAESTTSNSYADFYMLLDNTPSMGIGATQSDIDALMKATANAPDGAGRNCAFACHMVWSNSGEENPDSNYLIARKLGITLRIDVLARSVQSLMDDVAKVQGSQNLFRFAAYSFGQRALEPGYQIQRIAALTDSLSTVKKNAGDLTLMTTDHHSFNGDALTSFDTALTRIWDEIGADGGDGSSTKNRQQIVFFVTDGLGDSLKPKGCTGKSISGDGRCLEPIDLKYCDTLKSHNIKIAILYTTYLPLPSDAIWNNDIKPNFATLIGPRLQQCASEDLFFEAGVNDDMSALMKKLLVKAATASRLRISS